MLSNAVSLARDLVEARPVDEIRLAIQRHAQETCPASTDRCRYHSIAGRGAERGTAQSSRASRRTRRTRTVPAETHIERSPMDRQAVFELIRDQLADILETDPGRITEGASFTEDLNADSLALIELVEALEEELGERSVGFRIDDEDLEDLRTVRDAVDYVVAKLGGAVDRADAWRASRVARPPGPRGTAGWRSLSWATAFSDPALLHQALSHRSWCTERDGEPSNERLEFLGDAVLGLVVAEHCYAAYPDFAEGQLAKVRSAVVNARVLAQVAGGLGVGDVLLLGRGEESSGGRTKASILADAFEAVIGAVYLDGGLEAARRARWCCVCSPQRIERAAAEPDDFDQKGLLQEMTVRQGEGPPRVRGGGRPGPDHDRRYRAAVFVGGACRVRGRGPAGRRRTPSRSGPADGAWPAEPSVGPGA